MSRPLTPMMKLKPGRVHRDQQGGLLLETLLQIPNPVDDFYPEAWIGDTMMRHGMKPDTKEGITMVVDGDTYTPLRDVLNENPMYYLGRKHHSMMGNRLGIRLKLIDTIQRRTISAHPCDRDSKQYFMSEQGKTEAWYVIQTRQINQERPCIYFGFKPDVTKEMWKAAIEKKDPKALEELMHKKVVKPKDCFYIPAGVPHAIGPGCLVLEIQEPSDLQVDAEHLLDSRHAGVSFEQALNCFKFDGKHIKDYEELYKISPRKYMDDETHTFLSWVDYRMTDLFSLEEILVKEQYHERKMYYIILLVLEGEGVIESKEMSLDVKQGDTIFLSALLDDYTIRSNNLRVLKAYYKNF